MLNSPPPPRSDEQNAATAAEGRRLLANIFDVHLPSKPEFIRLATVQGGKHQGSVIAGFWPSLADKEAKIFRDLWNIADSSADSIVAQADRLRRDVEAIASNVNLSSVGRREAVRARALEACAALERPSRRFLAALLAAETETSDLVDLEAPKDLTVWQQQCDLETGRLVRALSADELRALRLKLMQGEANEMLASIMRLPVHLSGFPAQDHQKFRSILVEERNPGFGQRYALLMNALVATAATIDRFAKLLESDYQLTADEARPAMGKDTQATRAWAAQASLAVTTPAEAAA